MIRDDKEMAVSRERLAKLEHTLETLRNTARPEEWPASKDSQHANGRPGPCRSPRRTSRALMAIELVLDASVSLAGPQLAPRERMDVPLRHER